MVIYRSNAGRAQTPSSPEDRLASVERHQSPTKASATPPPALSVTSFTEVEGDIVYGAKAIAAYLFDADDKRTRRRVFNLWSHYRDRKEKAGFFKLKGAVCLSKSQWREFHGL